VLVVGARARRPQRVQVREGARRSTLADSEARRERREPKSFADVDMGVDRGEDGRDDRAREGRRPEGAAQLALFANASPKSSGYTNNLGSLRSAG
jgi:hypothetical protein